MNFNRTAIAVLCLLIIASGIAAIFWKSEWRYSLPTPVPSNYQAVYTGQRINTHLSIQQKGKPLFLHFFNPDCPCSKFNMPHFRSLANEFGKDINFAVVIMSNKNYSPDDIKSKYDLSIPVLMDTSLATKCGVYSTPQAVLIDEQSDLYYRGNYNKNRYCTDKKSNYAQQAIESLLRKDRTAVFNAFALKAYGCSLPQCTQR